MTNLDKQYTYPCGCTFNILGPPPLPKSKHPALELDWDKVPLDCKATYDLLSTGKTRMTFQLELGAGRQGCKELKPETIEHLCGLGAALRPGSSNSVDDEGISISKHYYRRKNGEEEIQSYHPALDDILGETYNCLLYQESAMKIAEKIAGFSKQEADNLRKATGKKLTSEMAKVKTWFIDGAKKQGVVTEKQAAEIFSWIQQSVRYSFNKCVSPDTLVETIDGLKILEEIQVGEFINTPEGFSEVIDKIDTGIQEVYQVSLESGKEIECTLTHKFLCEDNLEHALLEILENNLRIVCESE